MLASTAASLRPPLRRIRGGASPLAASRAVICGANPLFPRTRRRTLACRADLQQDAPFAAAIGACVLSSLVLPPPRPRGEAGEEVDEEGELGATDTRMAVMGIISFLPYFNWLVSGTQWFAARTLRCYFGLMGMFFLMFSSCY